MEDRNIEKYIMVIDVHLILFCLMPPIFSGAKLPQYLRP